MRSSFFPLFLSLFFLFTGMKMMRAQSYTITSSHTDYECSKGAAGVNLQGLQNGDVLSITWSTGATNVTSINELEAGDYTAQLTVPSKLDTTISFKIEKTECKVSIFNHFTPNDDGYNDTWSIGNWEFYPDFHLYVFDKWGQQVHKQSGTYTKWNGLLGGSGIPVADGTYYYVFYYEGNSGKLLKGDVTILR
jgi:gliding motility-associated-like protein